MRTVELLNYTDYETIGKAREFYVRVKAENPEFMLAWYEFYECIKNTFILKADETGIKRYEDMLGIEPEGSLEDRRLKIYMQWNANVIWTDRTLRQFLDLLIGKDAYRLEFNYDKYALKIKLILGKRKVSASKLVEELKSIIPCNIALYTSFEVNFEPLFASAYRRALHIIYGEYINDNIKGNMQEYFAGYLVSAVRYEKPVSKPLALMAKGLDGHLESDIGEIQGVMYG